MSGEGQLVRSCENPESDRYRTELSTSTVAMTLDVCSDTQLNFHQPVDEPYSMDYEESGLDLHTSPTP
jgi:hypothetical protein